MRLASGMCLGYWLMLAIASQGANPEVKPAVCVKHASAQAKDPASALSLVPDGVVRRKPLCRPSCPQARGRAAPPPRQRAHCRGA